MSFPYKKQEYIINCIATNTVVIRLLVPLTRKNYFDTKTRHTTSLLSAIIVYEKSFEPQKHCFCEDLPGEIIMPKLTVIAALLLMLSACAAWNTPSTYSNHNTPTGNVVTAQGRAAENAASANTSHNCPSCARGSTQSNNSGGYYDASGRYHPAPRPTAETQFVNGVKSDFYTAVRAALTKYTYDLIYD